MNSKKIIIAIVLFMALIFILSCIPTDKIKADVRKVFGINDSVKAKLKKMVPDYFTPTNIQNALHIPFFGFLTYLWMRFFNKRGLGFTRAACFTLLIAIVFSLLSEMLQAFTPGRDTSFGDLILDIIGSAAGIIIWRLTYRRRLA